MSYSEQSVYEKSRVSIVKCLEFFVLARQIIPRNVRAEKSAYNASSRNFIFVSLAKKSFSTPAPDSLNLVRPGVGMLSKVADQFCRPG
jgi:hypothetical protein